MLDYWQIMGILQLDEDHMTLQAMEQTPEVAWLCEVAEEAKARFHAWEAVHHPEAVAALDAVPERGERQIPQLRRDSSLYESVRLQCR